MDGQWIGCTGRHEVVVNAMVGMQVVVDLWAERCVVAVMLCFGYWVEVEQFEMLRPGNS